MIKTVKIEKVWRGPKVVKKGTPDEKEIDSVGIKIVGYEKWISTFNVAGTEGLDEGWEGEIDVITKGDFMNFKMPPVDMSSVQNDIKELKESVGKLNEAVFTNGEDTPSEVYEGDGNTPVQDDIPF